jgi:hypothetical protein
MSERFVPKDHVDHEQKAAKLAQLRARIDAADAAYQEGRSCKSLGVDAMNADIISRGTARLGRKD